MKTIKALPLMALLLVFSACGHKEETQETKPQQYCLDEKFKSKIKIEAVPKSAVSESIHLMGNVNANPDKVIPYVSLIDGIVASANFSLGDKVAKNQVLAEVKSIELSALQAQRSTIDAQLRVAQKKLQATTAMYSDGIASQKEMIEVQSELDILKSEKQRVDANLNLYSASTSRGVFQVKAPASGIITSKAISTGEQISSGGEVLFTISNLDEVWVMANIYATNIQNITQGMEVAIQTLSYPDEVFKGKIAVISQVLDDNEKVLKARIVLANPAMKLKPGMLVDVFVTKKQPIEAVNIPVAAIVFSDNENYVLVYKDDCTIEIRKVEILVKNNDRVFIAKGLEEGEKIITQNQLLIYEQIKNLQN